MPFDFVVFQKLFAFQFALKPPKMFCKCFLGGAELDFSWQGGWDRKLCLVIFHGNTILLSRTNMDNMDKTAAEVLQGMIYGIEATYGRLYIWSVMEVTDKSHLSSFLGLVHNNGKRTRNKPRNWSK